jgi:hypothetical protein
MYSNMNHKKVIIGNSGVNLFGFKTMHLHLGEKREDTLHFGASGVFATEGLRVVLLNEGFAEVGVNKRLEGFRGADNIQRDMVGADVLQIAEDSML